VKVRRPGLKVSFRHGYYARDTIRPYDREEFLAYSRISAAAGYEFDIADIPFKAMLTPTTDAFGRVQTRVDLLIDASKVAFRIAGDRQTARLRIAVFVLDGKDNLVGEEWKAIDLRLQEETYQQFLRAGIPFSASLALNGPKQAFRVVVYDPASDKIGSKLVK